jgi:hypothetical protein
MIILPAGDRSSQNFQPALLKENVFPQVASGKVKEEFDRCGKGAVRTERQVAAGLDRCTWQKMFYATGVACDVITR